MQYLKNQLQQGRQDSLLKDCSLELIEEIIKIEKIGNIDPEAAIGKARKVAETIVTKIYNRHVGSNKKPLFIMIEDLSKKAILPQKIEQYFQTIRVVGNLSVHYKPKQIEMITLSDLKLITIITTNIVEWYITLSV